ncbi:MAG: sigma-70 family RNA polymerase sigma factor [Planctomycetota bacterium]
MPEPPTDPPATLDLVHRAQAGDAAALEGVVARTYPRVLEIVRQRLGPGLRRYAESGDVVQEAMGELARGIEDFEPRDEAALVRWMARVVENRLRMLARHHARGKRDGNVVSLARLGGPAAASEFEPAKSTLSPLDKAARSEELERLRAAIEGLEPKHRAVIEARREGATWDAVAQAIDLPSAGAARMLHVRAMAALASRLEREGPGE